MVVLRILHLQNWHIKDIIRVLPKIKEQQFDTVLFGPLSFLNEDICKEITELTAVARRYSIHIHLELFSSYLDHMLDNQESIKKLYVLCQKMILMNIDGFYLGNIDSILYDPGKEKRFFELLTIIHNQYLMVYAETSIQNIAFLDKYVSYMHFLGKTFDVDPTRNIYYSESSNTYQQQNILEHIVLYDYQKNVVHYPNTLFFARPFDPLWQDRRIKEVHEYILKKKRY